MASAWDMIVVARVANAAPGFIGAQDNTYADIEWAQNVIATVQKKDPAFWEMVQEQRPELAGDLVVDWLWSHKKRQERSNPEGSGAGVAAAAIVGVAALITYLVVTSKKPASPSPLPSPASQGLIHSGTRWFLFGDKLVDGLQIPLNTASNAAGAVLTTKSVPGTTTADWAAATEAANPPPYDVMVSTLGTKDVNSGIDSFGAAKALGDRIRARGATPVWLVPPALAQSNDPLAAQVVSAYGAAGWLYHFGPNVTIGADSYPTAVGYAPLAADAWAWLSSSASLSAPAT